MWMSIDLIWNPMSCPPNMTNPNAKDSHNWRVYRWQGTTKHRSLSRSHLNTAAKEIVTRNLPGDFTTEQGHVWRGNRRESALIAIQIPGNDSLRHFGLEMLVSNAPQYFNRPDRILYLVEQLGDEPNNCRVAKLGPEPPNWLSDDYIVNDEYNFRFLRAPKGVHDNAYFERETIRAFTVLHLNQPEDEFPKNTASNLIGVVLYLVKHVCTTNINITKIQAVGLIII